MKSNIISRLLLMLSAALALASCSSNDDPVVRVCPRTVLVYMVADNSLGGSGFDKADLEEMTEAAQNGQLSAADGRWIVYRTQTGTDQGKAPQLLELLPSGEFRTLKTYPDDPSVYSVDIDRMRQVMADTRDVAPADAYGLVLWSHGSGWEDGSSARSVDAEPAASPASGSHTPQVTSFGDDRGISMKVSSMAKALDGFHFDYLYFDCCFMATAEVAYELRHAADLIVASVCELPVDGMPYHMNLRPLLKGDPVQAAKNTFAYYDKQYGDWRTCAISATRTAPMDSLAAVTRQVMEKHFTSFDQVRLTDIQKFMRSSRRNTLWDMRQYVRTLCGQDQELLSRWNQAFDATVTYAAATPSIFGEIPVKEHCGLGTFILASKDQATYRGYCDQAWYKDVVSVAPALNN